jgi:AcrR family transcriptional regulator
MPRLIDTQSRTGAVAEAINRVLSRDGASGLSLRTVARESRVSTSSLLHQYGSREHLLRVTAGWTGRARIREIDRRTLVRGVAAFLPVDDDDVLDDRAWLAWLELWRTDNGLLTAVEDVRLDERALLAELFDYRLDRDALDALVALIDGLLVAVCAPIRPLALGRAREILVARADRETLLAPTTVRSFEEVRNRARRWRGRAAP